MGYSLLLQIREGQRNLGRVETSGFEVKLAAVHGEHLLERSCDRSDSNNTVRETNDNYDPNAKATASDANANASDTNANANANAKSKRDSVSVTGLYLLMRTRTRGGDACRHGNCT